MEADGSHRQLYSTQVGRQAGVPARGSWFLGSLIWCSCWKTKMTLGERLLLTPKPEGRSRHPACPAAPGTQRCAWLLSRVTLGSRVILGSSRHAHVPASWKEQGIKEGGLL